jgi:hypothetical protein
MFNIFGLLRQFGPMTTVAPRGNCIIHKHREYCYSIQIGYDVSCEWMGEIKNAITVS